MFLGSLQQVADVVDSPLTTEGRRALETALRYFHEAAPQHTKDEEESLFPRLRQVHDRGIESALSTLDALEEDHERADALHAEVNILGMKCLERAGLTPDEVGRFRQAITFLASIYGEHIRIEDNVVFPAANRALSSSQKSAIASEMASRRGIIS
jgi:hemerythrin-like domain-containing protein